MHALTDMRRCVRTIFCHTESCCFSFACSVQRTNILCLPEHRWQNAWNDRLYWCAILCSAAHRSTFVVGWICVCAFHLTNDDERGAAAHCMCTREKRRHKEKTEEKNDFMWNNYAKQSRKRKSEMHLCVVCAVGEKHLLRRLFTQNAFYFFCSFSVKKTNDTMQSHRNGVRVAYDVAWRRWPKYSQPEWPKQNMYEEKANILTEKMKSQLLRHRLSVWNVFSPSLCLRVCLDAEWSI